MSHYTTKIRDLVKINFDFGLKDYPIFNEDYRSHLNEMIIHHFYMREIGFDTPALFKFKLNQRMAEIMPHYNRLYAEIENTYILSSDDTTDTTTYNTKTTNKDETTLDSDNKELYQDTPEGVLDDVFNSDITSTRYATNATRNKTDSSTKTEAEQSNTGSDSKRRIGRAGKSTMELLRAAQEPLSNIDIMVLNSLKDLFMGVYELL